MTLYNLLVFVHLVAAFLLVGGLTIQRLGVMMMRSASHGGEALGGYRTYAASPRLIGPFSTVTVLTGLVLAWHLGYTWRALWISGSVLLLVVLEILRATVVTPQVKLLHAASLQAAADPTAHGAALIAVARSPQIHWGYVGIELVNTTILALMVFKPMSL
ncbi:MAG TPA: DUF2269 family protein [Longimicrobium sp.]|jgi:uncharacterized membrane protein